MKRPRIRTIEQKIKKLIKPNTPELRIHEFWHGDPVPEPEPDPKYFDLLVEIYPSPDETGKYIGDYST